MAISMALGTSLSGIVYNKLGFYGAYGLSSMLIIIGLVYGLLFVEEVAPITVVDENKSLKTTITEFFNFKQVAESLKMTFKKRPNAQRPKIIVLLIILMANAGTNNGSFWKCVYFFFVAFLNTQIFNRFLLTRLKVMNYVRVYVCASIFC